MKKIFLTFFTLILLSTNSYSAGSDDPPVTKVKSYYAKAVDLIKIAKKYDIHYWDGSRRTGYGGYKFIPGHWKKMAEQLIKTYNLGPGSKVLDVGCGKAFLLHEMKLLEPKLDIMGFDISKYALELNTDLTKPFVYYHKAQIPINTKTKKLI